MAQVAPLVHQVHEVQLFFCNVIVLSELGTFLPEIFVKEERTIELI